MSDKKAKSKKEPEPVVDLMAALEASLAKAIHGEDAANSTQKEQTS